MTMLLSQQPHNLTDRLSQPPSPAAPFYVRRAEEYMHAHADQPIGMDDLVAETRVSARSLHEGFRRFRDTTPMSYLKALRLARARAELAAAERSSSVTEIATRWGVFHLGWFARDYRQAYGECPSETRARGTGARIAGPSRRLH